MYIDVHVHYVYVYTCTCTELSHTKNVVPKLCTYMYIHCIVHVHVFMYVRPHSVSKYHIVGQLSLHQYTCTITCI